MAVAADQDMRVGPALTQVRQETGQNHGILRACGACPGPEVRCDQRMRRALKDKKRQIAIALVVMVIEGEFLLAMRGVIGVIEVGRMPFIMDGRRKAFSETNLAIDPTQQERTKIRR